MLTNNPRFRLYRNGKLVLYTSLGYEQDGMLYHL